MTETVHELTLMLRHLERHMPLTAEDRDRIFALPVTVRDLPPSSYLVREGERPDVCSVLISGYAFRQKLTRDGARQILSLHIPGDILDLQHLMLDVADHNIQVLTRASVAIVPREAMRDLWHASPTLADAIMSSMQIEASRFREWTLNVGRRDGRARLAHLLCEFAVRLDVQGLADGKGYELPMTQEHLGDALGLTPVHVNRMLRSLEADGLLTRNRRHVGFPNWEWLRDVADFSDRYLHPPRTAA